MNPPAARRASKIVLSAVLGASVACGPALAERTPLPRVRADPAPSATAAPPPTPPAARAHDHFAVASENATAVEVARAILERGGSASDATVAGVLTACLAQSASCSLGGGGVAVVWSQKKHETTVFDFRETAPLGIRRADHVGKAPPKKRRGVMVGVPGLVAGLFEIHRTGGRLPWKDVVTVVAEVAERGYPLSPYMAQALAWSAAWIDEDAQAGALLGRDLDAEARVGETFKNPGLGAALRTIADRGRVGFYEGSIADDVVASARALGSPITAADLSKYRAIVREPLRMSWQGYDLLTAPSPFAGGLVAFGTIGTLTRADIELNEWGSGPLVHLVAESMRAAYTDRALFVGDPDFTRSDTPGLLEPARLATRRASIRSNATTFPRVPSVADGGTLQFVVVDADGDIVSCSATLTSMFGSKIVTKSGFALNDALIEFTMDEYGQRFTNRGPNFPRGGARPATSLAPVLVLANGEPALALGGSGGLRTPTAVAQVLLAHLGLGMPIADSVAAPRFHVTLGGALRLDSGLAGIEADLAARGEVVETKIPTFAAVSAIALRREAGVRVLEPVFDPRKGGAITVGRDPIDVTSRPAPRMLDEH